MQAHDVSDQIQIDQQLGDGQSPLKMVAHHAPGRLSRSCNTARAGAKDSWAVADGGTGQVAPLGRDCENVAAVVDGGILSAARQQRLPLSTRMPELGSLEIFHAVAETGSLSGAARELGLTQQAVSRRLASLEVQIGVTLALRTTAGSRLTSAGLAVAELAGRMLDVARQADEELAVLRNEGRQRLNVAASHTIAEQLMPHWMLSIEAAARRRRSPAPRVTITATDSQDAISLVRDGSADLGFIENASSPVGLGSRVMAHDELVVVVSPDHEWAGRSKVVSVAELALTPLVACEPRSLICDTLTTALREAMGEDVEMAPPAFASWSPAAMRVAVLAGAGPAVMSRLAVTDDLASGRLRAVIVPGLDLRRKLRAVWVGGRTPPAAIRHLLDDIVTTRHHWMQMHTGANNAATFAGLQKGNRSADHDRARGA